MTELVFIVEEDADGGYVATALNESIVTEADTLELLRDQVRDAVRCHFGDDQAPAMVRLKVGGHLDPRCGVAERTR